MLPVLRSLMPERLFNRARLIRDTALLGKLTPIPCNTDALANTAAVDLSNILTGREADAEWGEIEKEIAALAVPTGVGGVNPGDRRALYYLVRALQPRSVLEFGTHIGASTIHIAAALRTLRDTQKEEAISLVSVDIVDVNDEVSKPWLRAGCPDSPREMVRRLGCGDFVTFVNQSSIDYLASTRQKYDLIFLDGDHNARTVYQEIPLSLEVLNPGGWLLLHDYYPGLRPLWSNKTVEPGPQLAVQRLISEGVRIACLPLGGLPWPTKLNSNVTSLALLGGV
jgi:predicted O-methyltransferase YrrM